MYKPDEGNVYFVRHCTTTWNEEKRIQGVGQDIHLSPNGEKEAERAVEVFQDINIDELWSADTVRHVQTATPIGNAKKLEIMKKLELREINFGELEGKLYREVLTGQAEPTFQDILKFLIGYSKSGELPEKREERAQRIKASLLKDPHKNRLLVYSGTIDLYVGCAIDNAPISLRLDYLLKNSHFHQYRIVDGKFVLKGLNLKEPIKD